MMRSKWFALMMIFAAAFSAAVSRGADATVEVSTRAELEQAVAEAKAGTRIAIAPGTYEGGLSFAGLKGTEGRPVVLAAADPSRPPVIQGGGSCLHLAGPAYVELHDLVLEKGRGNGLNIDDGGSIQNPAHHVVLRGLVVREIGSDRNHDGIKLSGLDDFRIESCTVRQWGQRGSGIDMVGCHRGVVSQCTFRDGDPIGANGVQMKGGSSEITVSRCRFENAGGRAVNLGGSTGAPYFRPAGAGYEAKDLVVEDSTFVGSMSPVAFVGVDGATVRHNTFYRPTRWLIRILQENQDPKLAPSRNGTFTGNIIALEAGKLSTLVNVGPKTSPDTFRFTGNFWYCLDMPERTRRVVQLPAAETDGVYGQDPQFRKPAEGDLELNVDSPARRFGPRPAEAGRPVGPEKPGQAK
jgi:hypothetical protein